jgi:hypothetical protein
LKFVLEIGQDQECPVAPAVAATQVAQGEFVLGRGIGARMRFHRFGGKPKGVSEFEENAEWAIKSQENSLVSAGPGSGKTELLAQRAAYEMSFGSLPSYCSFPGTNRQVGKKLLRIFKEKAPFQF